MCEPQIQSKDVLRQLQHMASESIELKREVNKLRTDIAQLRRKYRSSNLILGSMVIVITLRILTSLNQ